MSLEDYCAGFGESAQSARMLAALVSKGILNAHEVTEIVEGAPREGAALSS